MNLDELELDLDYLASMSHDETKREHRKSRKAKREKTKRNYGGSINKCIGKYASVYGKEKLHRYNRRVRGINLESSDYYKHSDFSYGRILWNLS